MATKTEQKKPTKKLHQTHKNRLHPEKQQSWAVMRGIFTCKKHPNLCPPQPPPPPPQKKKKQQQTVEETTKKSKKMKSSCSLCSNTKVMHRPETTPSPEVHKKRALLCYNNDVSSTSTVKTPLRELNGVVLAAKSSVSVSSSSSIGGNFRGMPFSRFSGCYECRMVVDPVLGFARDPSLRSSICSCP